MTDNISVPRELRQVLGTILNALDRDALEGKTVRGEMAQELRALLSAPAVEVEGLEVIGFHCMDSAGIETLEWRGGSYADEPLCSLPKAQAVIDKQAARIKELEKDADRYRWLLEKSGFGIRRNGVTELTVAFYEIQPDNIGQLSFAIDAAMGSEE